MLAKLINGVWCAPAMHCLRPCALGSFAVEVGNSGLLIERAGLGVIGMIGPMCVAAFLLVLPAPTLLCLAPESRVLLATENLKKLYFLFISLS